MADITPVTREEYYLAKAGGQDVPTPTPVPREEQYLAKLSGQDVNVPTPITRREKFLYAASGGDIELPSEDKMRRIEKFMAKAGGRDVTTPTAVTREEKFWDAITAESGIKTLTGRLPLFFKTTDTKLRDWIIYGNNEPGKNLLDLGEYDTTSYGLRAYAENGQLRIVGKYNDTSAHTPFRFYTYLEAGSYILSGSPNYSETGYAIQAGTVEDSSGAGFVALGYDRGDGLSFTLDNASWVVARVYTGVSAYDIDVDFTMPIMVRKSGTSKAFEPYQIGVGERTKNLLEITAYNRSARSVRVNDISAVRGYVSATGSGEVNWEKIFWRPPLEYGKTYILSLNVVSSTSAHYMAISDVSGTVVYNLALQTTGQKTLVINYTQSSFPNGIKLDTVLTSGNAPTDPSTLVMSDMMLVEGSTAPQTYIPYGYQIPLDIRHKTKNLLEITATSQTINGVTFTVDKEAGTITANGTASANARLDFHTTEMTVNATDIVNGIPSGATNSTYYILVEFENGTNAFGSNLDNTAIGDRTNFTPRVLGWRIYVIRGQTVNNLVFKPMIRPADTSPDFEPYYLINHEDIYIGNSPLTQGQSITKAQSGQDITLFNGDNIIDTSLYNKPEMLIKFKEYKE